MKKPTTKKFKTNNLPKYLVINTNYSNDNNGILAGKTLIPFAIERWGNNNSFIIFKEEDSNKRWKQALNSGKLNLLNNKFVRCSFVPEFGYHVSDNWGKKTELFITEFEKN